jgi:type 1 fimbria pilin
MRRCTAGILLLVLIGACSSDNPADGSATITGRLVAGPTCPVETDPPDPECAPRAVPDAEVVATLADGGEVRARSDENGSFRLDLTPGTVTITFAPVEGSMLAPESITVTVRENQTLDLSDVAYDTGIR